MSKNPRKFNLWTEPWISATYWNGTQKTHGIRDTLVHSGEIASLTNENGLVDFSISKTTLEPAANVIKARYTPRGELVPIRTAKEAIEREREYLDCGTFPTEAVDKYGKEWIDHFWLSDDNYPFFQVPLRVVRFKDGEYYMIDGDLKFTRFPAEAFNPRINASNSRKAGFPEIGGETARYLTPDQAARALLTHQAFSDCSPGKGLRRDPDNKETRLNAKPTPNARGAQWFYTGSTLFKTLTLNSPLCDFTYDNPMYSSYSPSWEKEPGVEVLSYPYGKEGAPESLAELYSLVSRRCVLSWTEDGKIDALYSLPGDTIDSAVPISDPMLRMTTSSDGSTHAVSHSEKTSDPIWTRFPVLYSSGCTRYYIDKIRKDGIHLKDDLITFHVLQVTYGNGMCSISSVTQDQMDISTAFIDPDNAEQFGTYTKAMHTAAKNIDTFARECAEIMSIYDTETAKPATTIKNRIKQAYYQRMEPVIRDYACGRIGKESLGEGIMRETNNTINQLLAEYGTSLVRGGKTKRDKFYGEALNAFQRKMSKLNEEYELVPEHKTKPNSEEEEKGEDTP